MPTGEMARWTIEAPTSLEFDEVTGLRVRLIAGSVAVLATDGKPSLDVSSVEGDPLTVTYEDGVLSVAHENLSWEGLLKWLRPQRHSAAVTVTVPRKCPAQVGVVHVTTVSGEVTLRLPAEADAQVNMHSLSGDVRSEFPELKRTSAPASRSVSGSLGAGSGQVSVTTMSGRVMLLRRAGREQPDNENEMEGEAS